MPSAASTTFIEFFILDLFKLKMSFFIYCLHVVERIFPSQILRPMEYSLTHIYSHFESYRQTDFPKHSRCTRLVRCLLSPFGPYQLSFHAIIIRLTDQTHGHISKAMGWRRKNQVGDCVCVCVSVCVCAYCEYAMMYHSLVCRACVCTTKYNLFRWKSNYIDFRWKKVLMRYFPAPLLGRVNTFVDSIPPSPFLPRHVRIWGTCILHMSYG